jgi:uncharacterized protein YecT (DUF1311 family)
MAGSGNSLPPNRDPVVIDEDRPRPRGISPVLIGLVVTVLVLLALIFFVGRDGSGSSDDRLADNALADSGSDDLEGMCANATSYGLVKKALFRQAAQVRGTDQDAYTRLAEYAFVRMEAPIMTGQDKDRGVVSCSGSVTLELPPGLAVIGGRRTLSGEVDYVLQPAADGSGTAVSLSHAEGIVTPLATLTRVSGASPQSSSSNPGDVLGEPAEQQPQPQAQPEPQPSIPDQRPANPSFDCSDARTRGEIAVCADPSLASLDRQMASQFNSAMSRADSAERDLLEGTRDRFLLYRDRCRSNDCIAQAYRGRVREIHDIMAGTWRRPN